ncbi:MAG TPA: helix-turn-helix domain-containing protein [Micromonosporaceae bacterium]|nr:helix-turn-helix domain-containing protein [Micromonosporaceae bacterium]
MPRVSQDQLEARRQQILAGARTCFARHGYEGATVRRLEEEVGLSRGAIFHHFRDKESLFFAVAEDDASAMVATVAEHGLVQVMRDLLHRSSVEASKRQTEPGDAADRRADGGPSVDPDVAGWLGTQLEVSRRLRTDPDFARRWAARSDAIAAATRERLARQRDAGVLRTDIDLDVLAQFLELCYDGLVLHLAMGRPTADLERVLDLVESAVRR